MEPFVCGERAYRLELGRSADYGLILSSHAFVVALGNGSLNDGNWHVVVATWDGSEISSDNAGDDLNMKLFVDSIDQNRQAQGPSYINVGRDAVSAATR